MIIESRTMNPLMLPRSTAVEQGISPRSISDFIHSVDVQDLGLHSFMLVRNYQVIAEHWWEPYTADQPHLLYSLSKSFTSTAAGFAISEGLFSLDDRLIDHFPDEAPKNPSDNLKKLRVRDALSMATGHIKDTQNVINSGEFPTWIDAFFSVPVEKEPGTHFLYNSGASYMISALVQKRSGMRLLDYLKPRLFDPLNIAPLKWEQSPEGIDQGGSGLYVTTEDIAKFGLLYLSKGTFNFAGHQRLLPESWIDEATRSHVSNGSDPDSEWAQGYGFQFWRCRHNSYRGDGAFGQYCIVVPEHDIVIAITAGTTSMPNLMNALWDNLLPGIDRIHADETANALIKDSSLTIPTPLFVSSPEDSKLTARTGSYDVDPESNAPYGLTGIRIEFSIAGDTNVALFYDSNVDRFKISTSRWSETEIALPPLHGRKLTKVKGGWTSENTFEMVTCCVQTPYILYWKLLFMEDMVTLVLKQNVSFSERSWPDIIMMRQAS